MWDSGQFHHVDGHFRAVMDVEIGHLGDPMMDLAAWRMRDTVIPFGDFDALYDRYGELTGKPVDMAAIQYHHLFFTLTNTLSFHRPLARADPEHRLHDLRAVGERDEPPHDRDHGRVPRHRARGRARPRPGVVAGVGAARAHLSRSLRSIAVDDPFVAYQVRIAFRLARHLQRFDEIGGEVVDADRADIAALTGGRALAGLGRVRGRARALRARRRRRARP